MLAVNLPDVGCAAPTWTGLILPVLGRYPTPTSYYCWAVDIPRRHYTTGYSRLTGRPDSRRWRLELTGVETNTGTPRLNLWFDVPTFKPSWRILGTHVRYDDEQPETGRMPDGAMTTVWTTTDILSCGPTVTRLTFRAGWTFCLPRTGADIATGYHGRLPPPSRLPFHATPPPTCRRLPCMPDICSPPMACGRSWVGYGWDGGARSTVDFTGPLRATTGPNRFAYVSHPKYPTSAAGPISRKIPTLRRYLRFRWIRWTNLATSPVRAINVPDLRCRDVATTHCSA